MNIKLVASDVDGTINNSEGEISDFTVDVVHRLKENGIRFVIATGRSYSGATKIIERLDMIQDGFGLVSLNGGRVYNFPKTDYLKFGQLSYEQSKWLGEIGRKYYLGILYCFEDVVYFQMDEHTYLDYTIGMERNQLRYIREDAKTINIRSIEDVKERFEQEDDQILKIVFVQSEDYMQLILDRVRKEIEAQYSLCLVGKGWAEVLINGVHKGNALLEYAAQYGIKREEIMAFGDAENDLDMLKTVGVGIAMGNAMDTLKAVADDVAKTNDEDGVAHYLLDHLDLK